MTIKLNNSIRSKLAVDNLARVIGADPELNVLFLGPHATPCINMRSKTIFLPNGDFSNDKYWKLCSGWICHEGGHNRYTEIETTVDFENEYLSKQPGFECIMPDGTASFSSKEEEKKAEIKLKRLHRSINLFEDIQMEEKTGNQFPLSKVMLAEMYSFMVSDGNMTGDGSNIVSYIEMYILNKLRVNQLGQEGVPEILNDFFALADTVLFDMKDRFDSLILEATGVNSTLMACELGLKLYEELEKLRDDLKDKEEQNRLDDSDDSDGSDGSDGSVTSARTTQSFSPAQLRKAIEDLDEYLDTEAEQDNSHDFHEAIKKSISQMASSFSDAEIQNFGFRFGFITLTEEDYNNALAHSRELRKLLSSLNKQTVRRNNRLTDRGSRIHSRKLVEVPMGATSVFKKNGEGYKRSDVGVINLRDISVSMHDVSVLALKANLAFTLACESVNNIDVADLVYPVQKEGYIDILKFFNKSVSSCFSNYENVSSGLHTPTATAINSCVEYFSRLNFSRKVIFIATDGDPSESIDDVCSAVKNAKKHGIDIVCVGYGIDKPLGFDGVYFKKINDISELNSLYKDLIRSLV
ncbi:VWA domain-containing protein [Klebsiella pneumoniae]|uniref:VWA domain-containing protein n=1 Tax=Klebsiella pneumoniae TaxID=573 RepID=UPI0011BF549C|nr:VWA domain-containing protein [Klebsiella pneumoniae]EKX3427772.1 VWA domain-containing protein [Klebsiella pneumoniae]KAB1763620.1 VWA domain-containing protein [Klebsiella pneumoniae]TXA52774.1 VWA domain-containing protein [Klebsiella pneumoniae]